MNFFNVLGLVFVVLKLTGLIDWSWAIVILPFIIVPASYVLWLFFVFILFAKIRK